MTTIYKTFSVKTKAVDPEAGIYEAMISTEDVDRDGDILEANGADLTNYLKNAVVLFGHNYREARAVVGKALEVVKLAGKGLKATFQFAPKDVSEDADLVRRLWAGGFLNATSVGFIPHKWEPRETEDGEKLDRGRLYTEWELLEFSIVPVPANQNALRLAIKAFEDDQEYGDPEERIDVDDAGDPGEPEANTEPESNDDPTPHNENEGEEEALAALSTLLETLEELYNGLQ